MAQAQVWEGGQRFSLREVALPALADGEILVRIAAATVCGSDRHTVSGRRAGACPSILGHEGVGTVVASRRPNVTPGQRLVFAVTSTCGTCPRCRRGLSAKCENVVKLGHEEFAGQLDGTYATHVVVRPGQAVAEVPDNVPDAVAAVAGCAVATVMACVEAAGEVAERRVLVNGVGMLGLVAAVAARAAGATVLGVDPNPAARATAHAAGIECVDTLPPQLFDVIFELSGHPAGVQACIDALDIGGTAVLAGSVSPSPEVHVDPEWLVRGWRTITGVHNYEPRHLGQAVDFLAGAGAQLPWEKILGARHGLSELPEVFASESNYLREVIIP